MAARLEGGGCSLGAVFLVLISGFVFQLYYLLVFELSLLL